MGTRSIFTLVLLSTINLSSASFTTLTKDGYQNVVIIIQEDSTYNSNCQETLDNVKELIRNTSTSFAQALDRPAYFGNVTIIVPSGWASDSNCLSLLTATNVSDLAWARTSNADIQITSDHPVFHWRPYSFQYGGCKQPGLPINVPSTFMSDQSVLAKGKRMAREWAHYRYGVFDEGGVRGDLRHPSAYTVFQTESSDMITRANTCSDNRTPNGQWTGDCTLTGNSSCEYVPYINNPDIKSSLMYQPEIESMEKFCTKDNHDDSVPSKQSYYCGSLSASEVIYKHPDYTPGVTPFNKSADIIFNVIQNPFRGYHIVLDIVSFPNASLFDVAKSSVMQFINFLVDPVQLSIDIYDSKGWAVFQSPIGLNHELRESILNNLTDLNRGDSGDPNSFDEVLQNALTRSYDGQDVIFLTAADKSDLASWVTSYQTEKVNAHLLYFGVSSNKLIEMAKLATYGSFHSVPNWAENNQVTSSYTWATNSFQSIHAHTKTYRAKIAELPIIRSPGILNLNKNGTFDVDSAASRLLLSLYSIKLETLRIEAFRLFKPTGEQVDFKFNETSNRDEFLSWMVESSQELLPPGMWRYEVELPSSMLNKPMRLDVWAENSNYSAVELKTWNSAVNNQGLDISSAPVGLYAQLTQNKRPIRGANVVAAIYAGSNNGLSSLVTEIRLNDEGVADVTSGDGIYSAWLDKLSNSSLIYSIYYRAYGVNSLAMVDDGVYTETPTTGSNIWMSDPVPVVNQFNRFGYGPSFQVTLSSNGPDQIPPQRISDLNIASYDSSSRQAVLQWTAAKDNYGTGDFVTYYRLEERIGSNLPSTKTSSFSSVNGTLSWTIDVPVDQVNQGEYVRYRLQGLDSSDNWAELSNVVSLAGPASYDNNLSAGAITGIVIGVFLLLIILLIILVCCCCPVEAKRRKRQATRQVQQLFKTKDKNKQTETATSRYQPPSNAWQSPVMQQITDSPVMRQSSDSYVDHQAQVEVRQKSVDPATASTRGSERIYFGQEDIDRMTLGPRSETYSERGTEEMVKRAPSMDLQLATILKMNSSNLSIDRLGLNEEPESKVIEVKNTKIYARPFKPNQNNNSRPTSGGPAVYYHRNKPLSLSETNLYYTDVALRPTVGPSTKSTPSNSYLSVYAERAEVVAPQSTQSTLTNTLRAGLRNDEWQDSNSFIYTDPRFDVQPNQGGSTFDPQTLPANQVGLPPALPSVPPPLLPRSYLVDDRSSNASSMSGMNPPPMGRSSSKPSLISAV